MWPLLFLPRRYGSGVSSSVTLAVAVAFVCLMMIWGGCVRGLMDSDMPFFLWRWLGCGGFGL